ncbi:MAG: tRNA (adenosine(37)-N6)-dimethylallyltransferase MiaA [Spirochaetota bacterium]
MKKNRTVDRVIITGPTASGKSALALDLCRQVPDTFEIVSADSVQVYRGLDIGSGKVSRAVREQVPHHLIDILDPDESFDVSSFCAYAERAERDIYSRDRVPLVVGGTFLYIHAYVHGISPMPEADPALRAELETFVKESGSAALHERLKQVDPASAARIHPNDKQRLIRAMEVYRSSGQTMSELRGRGSGRMTAKTCMFALVQTRDELYGRINARFDGMIREGLVDEVRQLHRIGYDSGTPALKTIGYAQMSEFMDGLITLDDACENAKKMTRRYAKKQMTWINGCDTCKKVDYRDSHDIIINIKRTLEAGREY